MRAVRVDIGLNTCCYTRRWEAPKHWISLSKEAGYDYVQIDSDALDPLAEIKSTREEPQKN
jgi:hypothetical protein